MVSQRWLISAMLTVGTAFVACGGDRQPTTPPPAFPSPTTAVQVIAVEVRDGSVVGGVQRIRLTAGDPVRLTLRSDVADEVHVHGIDERADVAAGGEVTMNFTVSIQGVFEVELEERKLKILELEVR